MVFMIVLTLLASYAFIIGIVYNQTYRIMRQDARQEQPISRRPLTCWEASISRRWTTSIQILV